MATGEFGGSLLSALVEVHFHEAGVVGGDIVHPKAFCASASLFFVFVHLGGVPFKSSGGHVEFLGPFLALFCFFGGEYVPSGGEPSVGGDALFAGFVSKFASVSGIAVFYAKFLGSGIVVGGASAQEENSINLL